MGKCSSKEKRGRKLVSDNNNKGGQSSMSSSASSSPRDSQSQAPGSAQAAPLKIVEATQAVPTPTVSPAKLKEARKSLTQPIAISTKVEDPAETTTSQSLEEPELFFGEEIQTTSSSAPAGLRRRNVANKKEGDQPHNPAPDTRSESFHDAIDDLPDFPVLDSSFDESEFRTPIGRLSTDSSYSSDKSSSFSERDRAVTSHYGFSPKTIENMAEKQKATTRQQLDNLSSSREEKRKERQLAKAKSSEGTYRIDLLSASESQASNQETTVGQIGVVLPIHTRDEHFAAPKGDKVIVQAKPPPTEAGEVSSLLQNTEHNPKGAPKDMDDVSPTESFEHIEASDAYFSEDDMQPRKSDSSYVMLGSEKAETTTEDSSPCSLEAVLIEKPAGFIDHLEPSQPSKEEPSKEQESSYECVAKTVSDKANEEKNETEILLTNSPPEEYEASEKSPTSSGFAPAKAASMEVDKADKIPTVIEQDCRMDEPIKSKTKDYQQAWEQVSVAQLPQWTQDAGSHRADHDIGEPRNKEVHKGGDKYKLEKYVPEEKFGEFVMLENVANLKNREIVENLKTQEPEHHELGEAVQDDAMQQPERSTLQEDVGIKKVPWQESTPTLEDKTKPCSEADDQENKEKEDKNLDSVPDIKQKETMEEMAATEAVHSKDQNNAKLTVAEDAEQKPHQLALEPVQASIPLESIEIQPASKEQPATNIDDHKKEDLKPIPVDEVSHLATGHIQKETGPEAFIFLQPKMETTPEWKQQDQGIHQEEFDPVSEEHQAAKAHLVQHVDELKEREVALLKLIPVEDEKLQDNISRTGEQELQDYTAPSEQCVSSTIVMAVDDKKNPVESKEMVSKSDQVTYEPNEPHTLGEQSGTDMNDQREETPEMPNQDERKEIISKMSAPGTKETDEARLEYITQERMLEEKDDENGSEEDRQFRGLVIDPDGSLDSMANYEHRDDHDTPIVGKEAEQEAIPTSQQIHLAEPEGETPTRVIATNEHENDLQEPETHPESILVDKMPNVAVESEDDVKNEDVCAQRARKQQLSEKTFPDEPIPATEMSFQPATDSKTSQDTKAGAHEEVEAGDALENQARDITVELQKDLHEASEGAPCTWMNNKKDGLAESQFEEQLEKKGVSQGEEPLAKNVQEAAYEGKSGLAAETVEKPDTQAAEEKPTEPFIPEGEIKDTETIEKPDTQSAKEKTTEPFTPEGNIKGGEDQYGMPEVLEKDSEEGTHSDPIATLPYQGQESLKVAIESQETDCEEKARLAAETIEKLNLQSAEEKPTEPDGSLDSMSIHSRRNDLDPPIVEKQPEQEAIPTSQQIHLAQPRGETPSHATATDEHEKDLQEPERHPGSILVDKMPKVAIESEDDVKDEDLCAQRAPKQELSEKTFPDETIPATEISIQPATDSKTSQDNKAGAHEEVEASDAPENQARNITVELQKDLHDGTQGAPCTCISNNKDGLAESQVEGQLDKEGASQGEELPEVAKNLQGTVYEGKSDLAAQTVEKPDTQSAEEKATEPFAPEGEMKDTKTIEKSDIQSAEEKTTGPFTSEGNIKGGEDHCDMPEVLEKDSDEGTHSDPIATLPYQGQESLNVAIESQETACEERPHLAAVTKEKLNLQSPDGSLDSMSIHEHRNDLDPPIADKLPEQEAIPTSQHIHLAQPQREVPSHATATDEHENDLQEPEVRELKKEPNQESHQKQPCLTSEETVPATEGSDETLAKPNLQSGHGKLTEPFIPEEEVKDDKDQHGMPSVLKKDIPGEGTDFDTLPTLPCVQEDEERNVKEAAELEEQLLPEISTQPSPSMHIEEKSDATKASDFQENGVKGDGLETPKDVGDGSYEKETSSTCIDENEHDTSEPQPAEQPDQEKLPIQEVLGVPIESLEGPSEGESTLSTKDSEKQAKAEPDEKQQRTIGIEEQEEQGDMADLHKIKALHTAAEAEVTTTESFSPRVLVDIEEPFAAEEKHSEGDVKEELEEKALERGSLEAVGVNMLPCTDDQAKLDNNETSEEVKACDIHDNKDTDMTGEPRDGDGNKEEEVAPCIDEHKHTPLETQMEVKPEKGSVVNVLEAPIGPQDVPVEGESSPEPGYTEKLSTKLEDTEPLKDSEEQCDIPHIPNKVVPDAEAELEAITAPLPTKATEAPVRIQQFCAEEEHDNVPQMEEQREEESVIDVPESHIEPQHVPTEEKSSPKPGDMTKLSTEPEETEPLIDSEENCDMPYIPNKVVPDADAELEALRDSLPTEASSPKPGDVKKLSTKPEETEPLIDSETKRDMPRFQNKVVPDAKAVEAELEAITDSLPTEAPVHIQQSCGQEEHYTVPDMEENPENKSVIDVLESPIQLQHVPTEEKSSPKPEDVKKLSTKPEETEPQVDSEEQYAMPHVSNKVPDVETELEAIADSRPTAAPVHIQEPCAKEEHDNVPEIQGDVAPELQDKVPILAAELSRQPSTSDQIIVYRDETSKEGEIRAQKGQEQGSYSQDEGLEVVGQQKATATEGESSSGAQDIKNPESPSATRKQEETFIQEQQIVDQSEEQCSGPPVSKQEDPNPATEAQTETPETLSPRVSPKTELPCAQEEDCNAQVTEVDVPKELQEKFVTGRSICRDGIEMQPSKEDQTSGENKETFEMKEQTLSNHHVKLDSKDAHQEEKTGDIIENRVTNIALDTPKDLHEHSDIATCFDSNKDELPENQMGREPDEEGVSQKKEVLDKESQDLAYEGKTILEEEAIPEPENQSANREPSEPLKLTKNGQSGIPHIPTLEIQNAARESESSEPVNQEVSFDIEEPCSQQEGSDVPKTVQQATEMCEQPNDDSATCPDDNKDDFPRTKELHQEGVGHVNEIVQIAGEPQDPSSGAVEIQMNTHKEDASTVEESDNKGRKEEHNLLAEPDEDSDLSQPIVAEQKGDLLEPQVTETEAKLDQEPNHEDINSQPEDEQQVAMDKQKEDVLVSIIPVVDSSHDADIDQNDQDTLLETMGQDKFQTLARSIQEGDQLKHNLPTEPQGRVTPLVVTATDEHEVTRQEPQARELRERPNQESQEDDPHLTSEETEPAPDYQTSQDSKAAYKEVEAGDTQENQATHTMVKPQKDVCEETHEDPSTCIDNTKDDLAEGQLKRQPDQEGVSQGNELPEIAIETQQRSCEEEPGLAAETIKRSDIQSAEKRTEPFTPADEVKDGKDQYDMADVMIKDIPDAVTEADPIITKPLTQGMLVENVMPCAQERDFTAEGREARVPTDVQEQLIAELDMQIEEKYEKAKSKDFQANEITGRAAEDAGDETNQQGTSSTCHDENKHNTSEPQAGQPEDTVSKDKDVLRVPKEHQDSPSEGGPVLSLEDIGKQAKVESEEKEQGPIEVETKEHGEMTDMEALQTAPEAEMITTEPFSPRVLVDIQEPCAQEKHSKGDVQEHLEEKTLQGESLEAAGLTKLPSLGAKEMDKKVAETDKCRENEVTDKELERYKDTGNETNENETSSTCTNKNEHDPLESQAEQPDQVSVYMEKGELGVSIEPKHGPSQGEPALSPNDTDEKVKAESEEKEQELIDNEEQKEHDDMTGLHKMEAIEKAPEAEMATTESFSPRVPLDIQEPRAQEKDLEGDAEEGLKEEALQGKSLEAAGLTKLPSTDVQAMDGKEAKANEFQENQVTEKELEPPEDAGNEGREANETSSTFTNENEHDPMLGISIELQDGPSQGEPALLPNDTDEKVKAESEEKEQELKDNEQKEHCEMTDIQKTEALQTAPEAEMATTESFSPRVSVDTQEPCAQEKHSEGDVQIQLDKKALQGESLEAASLSKLPSTGDQAMEGKESKADYFRENQVTDKGIEPPEDADNEINAEDTESTCTNENEHDPLETRAEEQLDQESTYMEKGVLGVSTEPQDGPSQREPALSPNDTDKQAKAESEEKEHDMINKKEQAEHGSIGDFHRTEASHKVTETEVTPTESISPRVPADGEESCAQEKHSEKDVQVELEEKAEPSKLSSTDDQAMGRKEAKASDLQENRITDKGIEPPEEAGNETNETETSLTGTNKNERDSLETQAEEKPDQKSIFMEKGVLGVSIKPQDGPSHGELTLSPNNADQQAKAESEAKEQELIYNEEQKEHGNLIDFHKTEALHKDTETEVTPTESFSPRVPVDVDEPCAQDKHSEGDLQVELGEKALQGESLEASGITTLPFADDQAMDAKQVIEVKEPRDAGVRISEEEVPIIYDHKNDSSELGIEEKPDQESVILEKKVLEVPTDTCMDERCSHMKEPSIEPEEAAPQLHTDVPLDIPTKGQCSPISGSMKKFKTESEEPEPLKDSEEQCDMPQISTKVIPDAEAEVKTLTDSLPLEAAVHTEETCSEERHDNIHEVQDGMAPELHEETASIDEHMQCPLEPPSVERQNERSVSLVEKPQEVAIDPQTIAHEKEFNQAAEDTQKAEVQNPERDPVEPLIEEQELTDKGQHNMSASEIDESTAGSANQRLPVDMKEQCAQEEESNVQETPGDVAKEMPSLEAKMATQPSIDDEALMDSRDVTMEVYGGDNQENNVTEDVVDDLEVKETQVKSVPAAMHPIMNYQQSTGIEDTSEEIKANDIQRKVTNIEMEPPKGLYEATNESTTIGIDGNKDGLQETQTEKKSDESQEVEELERAREPQAADCEGYPSLAAADVKKSEFQPTERGPTEPCTQGPKALSSEKSCKEPDTSKLETPDVATGDKALTIESLNQEVPYAIQEPCSQQDVSDVPKTDAGLPAYLQEKGSLSRQMKQVCSLQLQHEQ
ncbi:hypothetical protein L7F22_044669 [Adiantum nelumboides]|nr:hypothetical protein [Adiantum nelumboides]